MKAAAPVVFSAGLLLLFCVPHSARYSLSPQTIESVVHNEAHGEAFVAALRPVVSKPYSHQMPFIADLWAAIDEVNSQTDDWRQQINTSYQGRNYIRAFVKASAASPVHREPLLWLMLTFGMMCLGGLMWVLPEFSHGTPGIKHNNVVHSNLGSRGYLGIAYGGVLVAFYILLYRYPEYIDTLFELARPASWIFGGDYTDRWFFYGFLYTFAVTLMGVRMFAKYRHSRYHQVRTASVIFFQLGFAFLLPNIMAALEQPAMDLKLAWPLDYTLFYDYRIDGLRSSTVGWAMLIWGIVLALVVVPVMTYFYGKRWYCSWVCGCGALAETLGDPHRHLSDKSLLAWRIERVLIHGVLVFAMVMTGVSLAHYLSGGSWFANSAWRWREAYGFYIGFVFAGAVGTGFYPIMGNRVWCRFGCPLAAILGLVQRVSSRFRITTNGGQCISCGNCSTHCEMGIDVRAYAQRGENIVRASCVGCGVCSAVCPRGVLTLENGPAKQRHNLPLVV